MPAAGASPAIANGLLLLSALTLASSLFNTCLLSSGEGLDLLVQSDSLLPAQMAWDMHQSPAWARHFQWPRVPSLFPDMVWFHAAAWLGLSWRHAWLAYTPLILSMLAGAMGGLIAALRGESGVQAWLRGSTLAALAIALGMAAITLLAARTGLAPWKDALMVLAPASHGDGFILSLLATVAAMQAMRGNRKAWRAMLAFCVVGTFGDLLFVAAFLAPLAVASRLSAWQAGGRKAALTGQWGLLRDCTAACLAGWLGQSALFRQSVNEVELHRPADALRGMAGGMATAPWTGLCLLSAGVLIAAAGRRAWA
ncbi:MAG TPA: hypothetical protein VN222_10720, partial [Novosphingobium sp.]|nr:hypothetical protein [Novosphingobium sp.]